jgi:hypothetical protein
MLSSIRRSAAAVAALGALGLGGSAIAGAAETTSSTGTTPQTRPDRPQRAALASDVAARVKAAALAKVPGGTVLRTEAGGPYRTAYHAHVRTSDGTRQIVLVDAGFQATAVQAERARGDRERGDRDGRPGARGAGERPARG